MVIHSEGVRVGDSLFIIGETTGGVSIRVEELRNDAGERCEALKKGSVGAFRVPQKVRKGDKVFLRQPNVTE